MMSGRVGAVALVAGGLLATPGVPTCYYANSTSSPIYRHRVVEVVPLAADDTGSWVYPR